ncbi:MAG: hypothetical protein NZ928_02925 [Endomicrobia bacterium]|nr:hypothetical protein [Endomicrobiia bacterium]MDW8055582.1 hypothetical protein [Elusimicrobiota bacterium]
MKLLECKVMFADGKTVECNNIEQMLSIVARERKHNRIPLSFELSGIDTNGILYRTKLNFVEFSSQQRFVGKEILSQLTQQKLLGSILVEEKIITEEQLKEAVEIQNRYKEKLGEILVKFGYCKPEQILYALAKQLGLDVSSLLGQKNKEE